MEFRKVSLIFLILFLSFVMLKAGRVSPMIDAISIEDLRHHVQEIHFDRSPFAGGPNLERAAEYIYKELSNAGFQVTKEPFPWEGRWFHNVVAEKRGTVSPEKVLIVGAHYDTVPESPGADDNASAVAVLLEVARHVQGVSLGSTVRLVAFSLEESGYIGSTHYAKKTKQQDRQVIGMFSLEMVGFTGPKQNYPLYMDPKHYPNVGDFIGIVGNKRSEGLLGGVRQILKTHAPELPAEFLSVPGNGDGLEEVRLSDHSPFWDQGLPALLWTDTAFLRNPNYHRPTDRIETLDFEFMRKVAAGVYHTIMELAK
jgi:Zn-dependent M28 family amino/carboxypeptidase